MTAKVTFRLTFMWRFLLVTLAVSVLSAVLLGYMIESAHRRAMQTDIELASLERVRAELTIPLDTLAPIATVTPALLAAFERANDDALAIHYVTGIHVYGQTGQALFPVHDTGAEQNVVAALASKSFLRVESGRKITAYTPFFTRSRQAYVIAVDFSQSEFRAAYENERRQVFAIVAAVAAIIFLSLMTLAAGASRELKRRRREAHSTFVQTLQIMAEVIDLRDPYTAGHSQRVGTYSRALAQAIPLPERIVEIIESGALLHDIGKIGVPDSILFKPGSLDSNERHVIGSHPALGAHLLGSIAAMAEVVPCVLHHHEKVDGSGYPDKLIGEAIPIGARVIAVADAFDAMTTDRPYRLAMSVEAAICELARVAGTQLDAELVLIFTQLVIRGELAPPKPRADDQAAYAARYALPIHR